MRKATLPARLRGHRVQAARLTSEHLRAQSERGSQAGGAGSSQRVNPIRCRAWPSLVSYFLTPQKKARHGSGAKFARQRGCRVPSAEQRNDTPERGPTSAASHGRNAEPRNWFLCRQSDESAQKSPAEAGLSWFMRGACRLVGAQAGGNHGTRHRHRRQATDETSSR